MEQKIINNSKRGNNISNYTPDKTRSLDSEASQANKIEQAGKSSRVSLSDTKNGKINIKKNKEGKLPQRSERVFTVNNYKTNKYINFSVYKLDDALVAQRSEHLSNKQGPHRLPGSSPGQGVSIIFSKLNKQNQIKSIN